jgi:hypothetical protein
MISGSCPGHQVAPPCTLTARSALCQTASNCRVTPFLSLSQEIKIANQVFFLCIFQTASPLCPEELHLWACSSFGTRWFLEAVRAIKWPHPALSQLNQLCAGQRLIEKWPPICHCHNFVLPWYHGLCGELFLPPCAPLLQKRVNFWKN